MSPVAGAAKVAQAGLEPVMQLTCRDRNRLGLTSDLLGAWALGARNVLCLSGDPPFVGDHPGAKGVFDLDVLGLIGLVAGTIIKTSKTGYPQKQKRLTNRWRHDFQPPMMRFDDLPRHRESKPQTYVAGRKKRRGPLLRGLGAETGPVILHLDLKISVPVAARFLMQPDTNSRVSRIRLQGIEHYFRKGMFERGPVALEHDGSAARFVLELGGLHRLILSRFGEGFLDQRLQRESVLSNQ